MAEHLNKMDRFYIETRLAEKDSLSSIAKSLNVNKSTISREIKANTDPRFGFYSGLRAQNIANDRQSKAKRRIGKLDSMPATQTSWVFTELSKRTSPEAISGAFAKEFENDNAKISYQTIYRYIKRDKIIGGKLFKHLRRKGRVYRYEKRKLALETNVINKKSIEQRPLRVELIKECGHWEIDTIFGYQQKSFLLTMVDIHSMYTIVRKIPNKEAITIENTMLEIIQEHSLLPFKTITSDNGGEFANHKNLSDKLNFNWYFCHPYCSGERGLNENTNGLIRDFLPKRTDFRLFSTEDIREVQNNLNNRPRKRIDFKTPVQVLMDAVTGTYN